jgi:transposase
MAKQRRTYTRELGLGESWLRSWKTALASEGEQAFPGKGHLPAVEEELRRLRVENQRLRIEREILKNNGPRKS